MKSILKNILLYAFSLYVTVLMFDGLRVSGDFYTYLFGGFLLAVGFKILKPILAIISLPFNMISLGLFSILILSFILFLITLIYPQIEVRPFTFRGFLVAGVQVHPFYVSQLLSYVIISGTIYLTSKFIGWLFER